MAAVAQPTRPGGPDVLAAVGDDVAGRLDAAIADITRWATRQDVRAEVMRRARCQLPWSAVWLLARIAESGPVRPRELAAFLAVDASTITPRLQRLERDALARREPDPRDGRAALVRVTPEGTRLLVRLHRARGRLLQDLLHDWSGPQAMRIADALAELAGRLLPA